MGVEGSFWSVSNFDGDSATPHLPSVACSGPICPSFRNSRKKLLPPCGASQIGISQMSQRPLEGEINTVGLGLSKSNLKTNSKSCFNYTPRAHFPCDSVRQLLTQTLLPRQDITCKIPYVASVLFQLITGMWHKLWAGT